VDRCLAKRVLGILDENLVEVRIVNAMQPNKCSQDVRGKVLQDVKLIRCQFLHARSLQVECRCGGGFVTYCRHDVDISIAI